MANWTVVVADPAEVELNQSDLDGAIDALESVLEDMRTAPTWVTVTIALGSAIFACVVLHLVVMPCYLACLRLRNWVAGKNYAESVDDDDDD